MGDAMGKKNMCKTFSTEFFDWIIQSDADEEVDIFDWTPLSENSVERGFSTEKFDRVRNGLTNIVFKYKNTYPGLRYLACSSGDIIILHDVVEYLYVHIILLDKCKNAKMHLSMSSMLI